MTKYKISRPLVAMIGIGCYPNGGVLGDLKGIPTDYRNMIKLFVNHWGYSFIYQTDDNKIEYLSKSKLLKKDKKYQTNFKLQWNEDDITNFVQSVKKTVLSTNPDSLIFIISGHGDKEQVIIDSDFQEYMLLQIYSEFWNQEHRCPYLADKPKLFFVDACQGGKNPSPRGKGQAEIKAKGLSKNSRVSQSEKKLAESMTDYENSNNNNDNNDNNDSKNEFNYDDNDHESKNNDSSTIASDTKYLDYENFCYIYANLDGYAVVDGGILGGYLIQGIKSVLAQSHADTQDLNKLINLIGMETLRKVKGETKKKDENYKKSNNPARQIVQSTSNIHYQVYFSKRENT